MPSDRALLGRRRWVQRLLLGGVPWVASAEAARRTVPGAEAVAVRLQIGVAEPAGSGRQALARRLAERLARSLRQPAALIDLPAQDDAAADAWLCAPTSLPRVLLASRWGAVEPRSIAVLAREPLVLLAGRPWPADLATLRDRAGGDRWRCGVDASDGAAWRAGLSVLEALGLAGIVAPVAFRGEAQLLPAVVGGRIELAVRTGGLYLGTEWHPLGSDEAAGNLVDVVTAHRRGDARLLAVADRRRLPGCAEVPTLGELRGRPPAAAPPGANDFGRCLHLRAPADLPIHFERQLVSAAAALADDRR